MRENVCVRESRRMRKRENEREREKENERDTEKENQCAVFILFFPFIVDIIQFVGMCKGRGENMHIPRCLTDP